ncbi:MAG TPA: serine/threonine-protein kinase, partial [Verrucomicrobiae bacterium]|nr:serine/threonine-protein kinase [Verrucomicrobiae bacterium]
MSTSGSPAPASREETLLAAALERPTEQRSAFLDGACHGDLALRRRLEARLAAHEETQAAPRDESEAGTPTLKADTRPESRDESVGQVIGRYKVLQKIGEGGCGVVYMAEQELPVRRRVALKVIKPGMDTRAVIARFEAERQALALMDHTNIAKVLDAGATEAGRPYFVMELVRGVKFTEYCDQNRLPTRQRLELFVQICQAIQHAHQKGIIHRDIKPSNILVTLHDGVPVPKVIDFGIAKATTDQRLTDKTLFTAYEQFIGTPAYMSPEQAEMSGLDVDTRSDIYSLGVLLYELLTGRTPFDAKELMKAGVDGMRKTIREKEPPRPSTRVATLQGEELSATAAHHAAEAPKLISLLRGDLDWVVMKCLEKDRTRRYETANGLATDIQHYLVNEPVQARPPSKLYRFQKLARRNKTTFAAAGLVLAALIVGLVVSLYLYAQESAARRRAIAAEKVEAEMLRHAQQAAVWDRQIAQAGLLLMRQQYDESEHMLRDIPPHDTMVPFYNIFGSMHARRGEWDAALTNWSRVVLYAPHDHVGYHYLAPLLLQMEDVAAYKRCRAQILKEFGDTSDPRVAERMAKACLILPPATNELAVIARMADVALRGETNNGTWGFNLFSKGLAEYRLGHDAQAAEL